MLIFCVSESWDGSQVTSSVVGALQVKPLISGRVPVGINYSQPIILFNPYDTPLHVLEIYTSNSILNLELEPDISADPALSLSSSDSWLIPPQTRKTIIYLRAHSDVPTAIEGYVHVKMNTSEANFVIAAKITVSDTPGLYHGPGDSIDFGSVTVADKGRTLPLTVLSSTDQVLRVVGASVVECNDAFGSTDDCPNVTASLTPMSGMMEPKTFTDIGTLTFTPSTVQSPGYFDGVVQIEYMDLDGQAFSLMVPFLIYILKGTLVFPEADTTFLVGQPPHATQIREINVSNLFDSALTISRVSIPEEDQHMFAVETPLPPLIGRGDTATFEIACSPSEKQADASSSASIWTNISDAPFTIPLYSYSGKADFVCGPERASECDFGLIHLKQRNSLRLEIINPNPVALMLSYYEVGISTLNVTGGDIFPSPNHADLVDYWARYRRHRPLGSFAKIKSRKGFVQYNTSLVIPPGHIAPFLLEVEVEEKAKVLAQLSFKTQFEKMNVQIFYQALTHSVSITPKTLSFTPTMPGQYIEPKNRKSSKVQHLIAPQIHTIRMSPADRINDITNIYSDDPRLVITKHKTKSSKSSITTPVKLASISFDPTLGPYNENYLPQIKNSDVLPELTAANVEETKRAQNAWKRVLRKKRQRTNSKVYVDYANKKSDIVEVEVGLEPIQLGLPPSITFPLTQIRHVSREELTFTNPTQYPLLVGIEMFDNYFDSPDIDSIIGFLELSKNEIESAKAAKTMFNASLQGGDIRTAMVEPYGNISLSIEFRPDAVGSLTTSLLVRNNLTTVQALTVSGEAGRGTFGFPKSQPFIVDGGLSFPLTNQNLSHCKLSRRLLQDDVHKKFYFNVTVINRGNMAVKVAKMALSGSGECDSSGFRIENCAPFTLRPKRPKILSLSFQPDFSTALFRENLVVHLDGLDRPLSFHVESRLPVDAAQVCFNILPGPEWENKFKVTTVVGIVSIAALIFMWEYSSGTWSTEPPKRKEKAQAKTASVRTGANEAKISSAAVRHNRPKVKEPEVISEESHAVPKVIPIVKREESAIDGGDAPSTKASEDAAVAKVVNARSQSGGKKNVTKTEVENVTSSKAVNSMRSRQKEKKQSETPRSDSLASDRSTSTVQSERSNTTTADASSRPSSAASTPAVTTVSSSAEYSQSKKGTKSAKSTSADKRRSSLANEVKSDASDTANSHSTDKETPVSKPQQMPAVPSLEAEALIAEARARAAALKSEVSSELEPKVDADKESDGSTDDADFVPLLAAPREPGDGEFSWADLDKAGAMQLPNMNSFGHTNIGAPPEWNKSVPPPGAPLTLNNNLIGHSSLLPDRMAPMQSLLTTPSDIIGAGSLLKDLKSPDAHGAHGAPFQMPQVQPPTLPMVPPQSSVMASAVQQQGGHRTLPPGLNFDQPLSAETPQYASLPPLGGHDLAWDGSPIPLATGANEFRGMTEVSKDSLDSAVSPEKSFGTDSMTLPSRVYSAEPAPMSNSNSSLLDRWNDASTAHEGSAAPPAHAASGASHEATLPSIPYAGVDNSNIWSSGGALGDLDWAKPESAKLDPNASDWGTKW